MVGFGYLSETLDPVTLSVVAAKFLLLTRPSMMHYTLTRKERVETVEVFVNVASGVLRITVSEQLVLLQKEIERDKLEKEGKERS